jgi:dynein heavy chain
MGGEALVRFHVGGHVHRSASTHASSVRYVQDHYDFGMRAVKTVISAAGNLKRENPTMNEVRSIHRAPGRRASGSPDTRELCGWGTQPTILKPPFWPLLQELICLRAIRDVNVPKFLQEDLKLFSGIVSDLFPTIKEEETDYGILDQAIRRSCEKNNLKDVEGELPAPGPADPWCSNLRT